MCAAAPSARCRPRCAWTPATPPTTRRGSPLPRGRAGPPAPGWRGDGLGVARLKRVGPGTYRPTEPIPVHGDWKALVRLHRGKSLTAIPIYLPRDTAIPAKEVPAPPRFERTFIAD